MADEFETHSTGLQGPASNAATVTPGASAMANTCRALYVSAAGDATVTLKGGQSVTFSNLSAGVIYPLRCTHVTAATATLIALW